VDFRDLGAIQRGKLEDRWHYTYSVERSDTSLYARDTVGLYIRPDDATNRRPYEAEADRVRALVEPFRPLPVRFVWFVDPPKTVESVYEPIDIGESYRDDLPDVDYLGAIDESVRVALPDLSVLHTYIDPTNARAGGSVDPTDARTNVTANPADLTTLRRRTFYPAPG
jgi:hypothetical protein